MRRSDHPSRPSARIVASFARSRRCSHRRRVIALTSELNVGASGFSMAGFEVTPYGRFWATRGDERLELPAGPNCASGNDGHGEARRSRSLAEVQPRPCG